ncbi:cytochrome c oxidase subunit 3 [Denitromonas ohlonensis]|uniref:Cytochrome c oxidase subunit 3 family protein n=2 Tax=Denitromonas TaxID=139331 RepID=A0A558EB41_9RHOO|nr:cytochrome c oxidase subunit 3 [Denitromonas ohlonensis]TVO63503.1 cytochrome c oxidase subunit 3 family protein [Denitromonas ohlonensis]TVO75380.1 cytochrome c oxidase subunit 3 family protein [Denitromonas ohlonensis]TVT70621.1 MAG: cytochrome c oxidase subunit 3 family protein [Denitromonas halophila]
MTGGLISEVRRSSMRSAASPAVRPARDHIPGEIGIWLFVAGDLLVFSAFFIVIALGYKTQIELFTQARATLDMWVGVLNTLFLLTGSWFVAKGVESCRETHGVSSHRYFALGILCGVLFVANKSFEWGLKISAGITPLTNDFFMYFFVFTGIHLVHVVVGLGVLLVARGVSRRPVLRAKDIRTVESAATFWHLIDLLWIVLFSMFYLL